MPPIKIAIIGIGKISQDQHLPVIAKNPNFQLAAVVSQRGLSAPGVPTFKTPAELYAALPDLDAVAICTPPHVRHTIAREALAAGKHVMLEKPPAATVAQMHDLAQDAAARGKVIFATWHSQYNQAVAAAKKLLEGQRLSALAIEWKEDVRRWHPGQDWIWDAGNFGVFDPGINALSILTKIAPGAMFVKSAVLRYPENRDTPIAA
jgi:D-galactose 1-dehydrogenase